MMPASTSRRTARHTASFLYESTAGIPRQEAGSASALFNMMRNLGGSVGIAGLATFLTKREHFHSSTLGEAVSLFNPETQQRLGQLTEMFMARGADAVAAQNQALAALSNLVRREAFVMAYSDCFFLLACVLVLSVVAVMFFEKTKSSPAGAPAH